MRVQVYGHGGGSGRPTLSETDRVWFEVKFRKDCRGRIKEENFTVFFPNDDQKVGGDGCSTVSMLMTRLVINVLGPTNDLLLL